MYNMIKLSTNRSLARFEDDPFTAGSLMLRGEAAPITRCTMRRTLDVTSTCSQRRFHRETHLAPLRACPTLAGNN